MASHLSNFSDAVMEVHHSEEDILVGGTATNGQQHSEEANDGSGSEYRIVLPCIVIFGLCGNVISLVAIFHSRLRKMPANQYLIVLTLADSVFLAFLLLVLFNGLRRLRHMRCHRVRSDDGQLRELVEHSCAHPGSGGDGWSVPMRNSCHGGVSERYFAIAHPLKHVQYGGISRWRLMVSWLPIPFLMNLIQFVILIPNEEEGGRKCTLRDGKLQLVAEIFDVALCYLLPCLIVVTLNISIAMKIRSARKRFPGALHQRTEGNGKEASSAVASTAQPSSGSTRILFVVPVVYILLNTPFYLIRLCDTIAINLFNSRAFSIHSDSGFSGGELTLLFVFCYNGAHYLYYVNFACDVVVYAFSSSNFRRTVVIAWKTLLCPNSPGTSEYFISTAVRNVRPNGTTLRQLSTNNRNSSQSNASPLNGIKTTRNGGGAAVAIGGRRFSLSLNDVGAGRPLIANSVGGPSRSNCSSIVIRKQLSGKADEKVDKAKCRGSWIDRHQDNEDSTSLFLPYHSPTVVETISIRHSNVL